MVEIWKDVVGYEGLYQVSNLGRVKSLDKTVKSAIKNNNERFIPGIIMSFTQDKDGYFRIGLTKNKKKKIIPVHRIICSAFIENPENKPQVNHIDGIKNNNILSNLEWATLSENRVHSYATGLQTGINRRGEKSNFAKLTSDDVIKIRKEYVPYKVTQIYLAEKYGVSQAAINSILTRKNWHYL